MMLSQIPGGPNGKVKQQVTQFPLFIRREHTRTSNAKVTFHHSSNGNKLEKGSEMAQRGTVSQHRTLVMIPFFYCYFRRNPQKLFFSVFKSITIFPRILINLLEKILRNVSSFPQKPHSVYTVN